MKINLGSGRVRYDGFANIDHDPLTNPDYCIDLEKDIFPFDDNTVEEIRAYHVLEHIGEGFFHLMKEIYRICKHGAIIDIWVPHHRHENYFGDPTHRRPITVPMLQQFSKKWCSWHQQYWNSSSGFAPRLNVDFEIIQDDYVVDHEYEKMAEEGKHEELRIMARKLNNVFFETKIKLVVIKE